MKEISLGFIGLGYQGQIHLKNSMKIKDVRVRGVADTSKKALKIAQRSGIKNLYENYDDLLKDNKIDAVIVSLPNFLHLDCAVKVAESGKHMLLEKPLARNPKEGKKIISHARKENVKIMMGYNLRFDPFYNDLNYKIKDGFFGEVRIVNSMNIGSGPFVGRSDSSGPIFVPPWWFDISCVGGGALLDLGSHLINLNRWFFGEIEHIESKLGYQFDLDIEDIATCELKFKKGPYVFIHAGWFSKEHVQSIFVSGTSNFIYHQISPARKLNIIKKDVKQKLGLKSYDSYFFELKYFLDCILNDIEPLPNAEDGLKDLEVITSAYNEKNN